MGKWFGREQSVVFILSGFDTHSKFELREPCWEADDEFGDIESASAEAVAWLAGQPHEAQVEVIEVKGERGKVKRLISQSGIERIG